MAIERCYHAMLRTRWRWDDVFFSVASLNRHRVFRIASHHRHRVRLRTRRCFSATTDYPDRLTRPTTVSTSSPRFRATATSGRNSCFLRAAASALVLRSARCAKCASAPAGGATRRAALSRPQLCPTRVSTGAGGRRAPSAGRPDAAAAARCSVAAGARRRDATAARWRRRDVTVSGARRRDATAARWRRRDATVSGVRWRAVTLSGGRRRAATYDAFGRCSHDVDRATPP